MEEEGVGQYDFLKIKDLTFKISMVYYDVDLRDHTILFQIKFQKEEEVI